MNDAENLEQHHRLHSVQKYTVRVLVFPFDAHITNELHVLGLTDCRG